MKRKARKSRHARKERVLTEAELKKIAGGNLWEDIQRDAWTGPVVDTFSQKPAQNAMAQAFNPKNWFRW